MAYPDYDPKFREQARVLICQAIAERPMSVEDLIECVSYNQIPYSRRATKEAAWAMAEDGEAFFNSQWLLELTAEENIMPNFRKQLRDERGIE